MNRKLLSLVSFNSTVMETFVFKFTYVSNENLGISTAYLGAGLLAFRLLGLFDRDRELSVGP